MRFRLQPKLHFPSFIEVLNFWNNCVVQRTDLWLHLWVGIASIFWEATNYFLEEGKQNRLLCSAYGDFLAACIGGVTLLVIGMMRYFVPCHWIVCIWVVRLCVVLATTYVSVSPILNSLSIISGMIDEGLFLERAFDEKILWIFSPSLLAGWIPSRLLFPFISLVNKSFKIGLRCAT